MDWDKVPFALVYMEKKNLGDVHALFEFPQLVRPVIVHVYHHGDRFGPKVEHSLATRLTRTDIKILATIVFGRPSMYFHFLRHMAGMQCICYDGRYQILFGLEKIKEIKSKAVDPRASTSGNFKSIGTSNAIRPLNNGNDRGSIPSRYCAQTGSVYYRCRPTGSQLILEPEPMLLDPQSYEYEDIPASEYKDISGSKGQDVSGSQGQDLPGSKYENIPVSSPCGCVSNGLDTRSTLGLDPLGSESDRNDTIINEEWHDAEWCTTERLRLQQESTHLHSTYMAALLSVWMPWFVWIFYLILLIILIKPLLRQSTLLVWATKKNFSCSNGTRTVFLCIFLGLVTHVLCSMPLLWYLLVVCDLVHQLRRYKQRIV